MPRTFAEETATNPLFDDGVFRTVKVIDGQIENYDRQIERLIHDAKILRLPIPKISLPTFPKGVFRLKLIIRAVKRGSFFSDGNESVFEYFFEPYEVKNIPYRLKVFPGTLASPFSKIKTLDYAKRFYIREWAQKNGADEALILSAEGDILEASMANIFFIKEGKVFIPHDSLPYMKGLTLTLHEEKLRGDKIPIEYGRFKLQDLLGAEIFICSSLMGIQHALPTGSMLRTSR